MDPLTLFALANGAVAAVKKGCQLYKDIKGAAGDVKAVLKDLDEQFHGAYEGKGKTPTVEQRNQFVKEKNRVIELNKRDGETVGIYTELGEHLDAPIITGATPVKERERLIAAFREGEIKLLVVSKVANFSIDLPEAAVAIQVSGTFGSRQEEAQRLGRILRPKADGRTAHFYSIVTRDTVDADFAQHRQRFLAEQGYAYRIVDADDIHSGKWEAI